ncbi:MAG: hypothetical protein RRY64_06615, partial [Oscillospiraceae bacterium]
KGCAILRAAADSLESLSVSANKKVDDNPPLTLEELRGMDGEPVYLVFGTKKDGAQYEQWALVDAHTDDREINLVDGLGWNRTIQLDEEISGMRAYRRRPENEGRVVVLPCKMGEKIYINDSNGNTLELTAVNVAIVDSDGDANLLDWFGKTVFTSRAEAALKGAVENAD